MLLIGAALLDSSFPFHDFCLKTWFKQCFNRPTNWGSVKTLPHKYTYRGWWNPPKLSSHSLLCSFEGQSSNRKDLTCAEPVFFVPKASSGNESKPCLTDVSASLQQCGVQLQSLEGWRSVLPLFFSPFWARLTLASLPACYLCLQRAGVATQLRTSHRRLALERRIN